MVTWSIDDQGHEETDIEAYAIPPPVVDSTPNAFDEEQDFLAVRSAEQSLKMELSELLLVWQEQFLKTQWNLQNQQVKMLKRCGEDAWNHNLDFSFSVIFTDKVDPRDKGPLTYHPTRMLLNFCVLSEKVEDWFEQYI